MRFYQCYDYSFIIKDYQIHKDRNLVKAKYCPSTVPPEIVDHVIDDYLDSEKPAEKPATWRDVVVVLACVIMLCGGISWLLIATVGASSFIHGVRHFAQVAFRACIIVVGAIALNIFIERIFEVIFRSGYSRAWRPALTSLARSGLLFGGTICLARAAGYDPLLIIEWGVILLINTLVRALMRRVWPRRRGVRKSSLQP